LHKQLSAGADKPSYKAKASASGKWISSKKSKELKVRSGKAREQNSGFQRSR